jgi:hypothetical protein
VGTNQGGGREIQGEGICLLFERQTVRSVQSRRVTLECLTLKMREKVRRSFVTDLAKFRHIFIRQPVGFVITGYR